MSPTPKDSQKSPKLNGLPNANAKSPHFGYAISQIATLPPVVALNRSSKSQSQLDTLRFGTQFPKSHWPLSFSDPKSQHFKSQRLQDANANKSQTLAFYKSQRFSATKVQKESPDLGPLRVPPQSPKKWRHTLFGLLWDSFRTQGGHSRGLEAQQRYFSYRAILVAIVSQTSSVLVFVGYRTIIARYVAKWCIAEMCLCETKYQRGVSHTFWGSADLPQKVLRDMGYRSDSIANIARYGATKSWGSWAGDSFQTLFGLFRGSWNQ